MVLEILPCVVWVDNLLNLTYFKPQVLKFIPIGCGEAMRFLRFSLPIGYGAWGAFLG